MPKRHRAARPDAIAPDGIAIRALIDEPQGARQLSVCEGLVKPNERSTKVYEEIWYFLGGVGIFHLHVPGSQDEEAIPVAAGDAVLVPPRHGFWVENSGDGDLIFLLCGAPPWGSGQEVHAWPPKERSSSEA